MLHRLGHRLFLEEAILALLGLKEVVSGGARPCPSIYWTVGPLVMHFRRAEMNTASGIYDALEPMDLILTVFVIY